MQVDWGKFRQGRDPLAAFVATLGFSMHSYVEFVADKTIETLKRCHANAFDWFEGVPQRALCDNMKTMILARHIGETTARVNINVARYFAPKNALNRNSG